MKRYIYFLFSALVLAMTSACEVWEGEEMDPTPGLPEDPYYYFVDAEGENITSSSVTMQGYISAKGDVVLLPVSTNIGYLLEVQAKFRYSIDSAGQSVAAIYNKKTGFIEVDVPYNAYAYSREIEVRLSRKDYQYSYISCYMTQDAPGVSTPSISGNIDSNGGSVSITFDSSTDWEISSSASWISFSKTVGIGGDDITIEAYAQKNPGAARKANVTIKPVSGNSKTFAITQDASEISVSETYYSFFANGTSTTTNKLKVTATDNWSIKSAPDWVILNPNHGSKGDTDVIISCQVAPESTSASRTGTLTLQVDDTNITTSINLRQYY